MPENDLDLWPQDLLPSEPARSPVSILRQQAEALSLKTRHQVTARVDTQPFVAGLSIDNDFFRPQFRHRLILVVPKLEDYELELLSIYHQVAFYPLAAIAGKREEAKLLKNESELMDWLKQTFGSQETRKVLSTLVSLAA